MRYLLDTNVLSEPTKPRPHARVMTKLQQHHDEVCTAAPVWNELLYGCRRLPPSKRRDHLTDYLRQRLEPALTILPYDASAADQHAKERARLSQLGKTPPFVDGQIAAITQVHGLVLITANVNDYRHFAELTVEDWTQADG